MFLVDHHRFLTTHRGLKKIFSLLGLSVLLFSLSACELALPDWLTSLMPNNSENVSNDDNAMDAEEDMAADNAMETDNAANSEDPLEKQPLSDNDIVLGVSKQIQWMPWFFAEQNDVLQQFNEDYDVNIRLETGEYQNLINQYIKDDIQIIAITNIDAFSYLLSKNIESNVILISSNSYGNDALLANEKEINLNGKTVALKEHTASHYLLDRYLLKNQIPFDKTPYVDTDDDNISEAFNNATSHAVITNNPTLYQLTHENNAKVVFDSRAIPNEIQHLLIVRRSVLEQQPKLGMALLATWFDVISRLQGPKRPATLDALAKLAQTDRDVFEKQLATINFIETDNKAMSTLRDRRMAKRMRYISYFIRNHELASGIDFNTSVSYPGHMAATLHFDANPLDSFLAASATTNLN